VFAERSVVKGWEIVVGGEEDDGSSEEYVV
jgi:hypothetical protein